jgi:hypothetical protein
LLPLTSRAPSRPFSDQQSRGCFLSFSLAHSNPMIAPPASTGLLPFTSRAPSRPFSDRHSRDCFLILPTSNDCLISVPEIASSHLTISCHPYNPPMIASPASTGLLPFTSPRASRPFSDQHSRGCFLTLPSSFKPDDCLISVPEIVSSHLTISRHPYHPPISILQMASCNFVTLICIILPSVFSGLLPITSHRVIPHPPSTSPNIASRSIVSCRPDHPPITIPETASRHLVSPSLRQSRYTFSPETFIARVHENASSPTSKLRHPIPDSSRSSIRIASFASHTYTPNS